MTARGIIIALPVIAAFSAVCPAQTIDATNRKVVESLPDSVDLVAGFRGLSDLRQKPQGRALEEFLTSASDWTRTKSAWSRLARELGMSVDETARSLMGTHCVVAAEVQADADAPFALTTGVSQEARRELTARLGAAPRSVAGGFTILSLERGALRMAARDINAGATSWSQVVLSPHETLFDRVLRPPEGAGNPQTLKSLPEWSRIEPLMDSDVFLLSRAAPSKPGDPQPFFVIGATPTPQGWIARFAASDTIIHEGVADVHTPQAWPAEAVDQLEEGASLLIAGSPRAAAGQPATLLSGLLGMMKLPDELRAQMEGAAIIALTLPNKSDGGSSLVIALPLRDIPAGVDASDRWAASVAGVEAENAEAAISVVDGVREARIIASNPAILNGFAKAEGRMAWCYAAAGGIIREKATPGWVVIALRVGGGEAPTAMIRRTASQLAHEEGKDHQTLFRLVVEPRRLKEWMDSNAAKDVMAQPPPASTLPVSTTALRWLGRVESRITREGPGYVEGTVSLDLNLALLNPSAATPAAAQPQRARSESD